MHVLVFVFYNECFSSFGFFSLEIQHYLRDLKFILEYAHMHNVNFITIKFEMEVKLHLINLVFFIEITKLH